MADKPLVLMNGRTVQSALFNIAHAYVRTARLAWDAIGRMRDADFAGPGILCQSFSIELLLKFFIASDHPTARTFQDLTAMGVNLRGHSFVELWDRISDLLKEEIAVCYSAMHATSVSPCEFRQLLEALGDPFVSWRYVYESTDTRSLSSDSLNKVVDALGKAAEAIRKVQAASEAARGKGAF
jgi:hypothetical protein